MKVSLICITSQPISSVMGDLYMIALTLITSASTLQEAVFCTRSRTLKISYKLLTCMLDLCDQYWKIWIVSSLNKWIDSHHTHGCCEMPSSMEVWFVRVNVISHKESTSNQSWCCVQSENPPQLWVFKDLPCKCSLVHTSSGHRS